VTDQRTGVYPGSFNPLTIAHLAIAEAAMRQGGLERVDLVVSRNTLGKPELVDAGLDLRLNAIARAAASRYWLSGSVSDKQLIADIADGYDVVIMGADKWEQVNDPAWYADEATRDAAVARLPEVLVVPRPGFSTDGATVLDIDEELTHVSSTRVRNGEVHLIAPEANHRLIVDGNNVIGSRPNGWWRDRKGAARNLIRSLQELSASSGERIAVVFDGRPLPDFPEGVHDGVLVAYATRAGRDAADDRIAAEVERDRDAGSLTVVTSDRGLDERVRALGAHVVSAGMLLSAMERARQ
jgi:predicted RNA-binding protein with PIN domain